MKKKISVIIMTLNAEKYIKDMIETLLSQTVVPDEIIVADSQSDDDTVKIVSRFEKVRVLEIKREEFDHGGSRDYALRQSIGEYVLFFTQDAVLRQKDYIEVIISNFCDENVAMVYGRQVAKSDAHLYERYIREFNYPDKRCVKAQKNIEAMGIKAFYMSDVCSAYSKEIYYKIGGFDYPIITNEDMLIACHALKAGFKVVYDPSVYVYHSHNFSCKQEFKRNFDVSVFMQMHLKEFEGIKVDSEGIKLVKYVSVKLLKKFHIIQFIRFGLICTAKFLGNRFGKNTNNYTLRKIDKYSGMPHKLKQLIIT